MKKHSKTILAIVAILCSIGFGIVAMINNNPFIALFGIIFSLFSIGVSLGIWWEKGDIEKVKIYNQLEKNFDMEGSLKIFDEPTFAEKIKNEEKRIRKVRSDKGVKRK